MGDEEIKKEASKINELITKINAVKTGLLDERKKSQNYLGKIKEFERALLDKDELIAEISKEKYRLETQLNFEKTKKTKNKSSFMDRMFHKEKFSNEKLEKLKNENNKIREANRGLAHQIEEEKELYDQDKIKFQTALTVKAEELKKVHEKINALQKKLSELLKENAEVNQRKKDYDSKKQKYVDKLAQYEKDLEESKKGLETIETFLKEAQLEKKKVEEEIAKLTKQQNDLAIKLGETKNAITNKNLTKRTFKAKKVEKIFNDKLVSISFEKKEETNQCVMTVQDDDKIKEINLLSINSFELNEKIKNRIEIQYSTEEKGPCKLALIVHEKITDYVMDSYREFFKEANKYI